METDEVRNTPDRTDWSRVKALTDAEIEQAAADDPDAAPVLSYEQTLRDYKPAPARIHR